MSARGVLPGGRIIYTQIHFNSLVCLIKYWTCRQIKYMGSMIWSHSILIADTIWNFSLILTWILFSTLIIELTIILNHLQLIYFAIMERKPIFGHVWQKKSYIYKKSSENKKKFRQLYKYWPQVISEKCAQKKWHANDWFDCFATLSTTIEFW